MLVLYSMIGCLIVFCDASFYLNVFACARINAGRAGDQGLPGSHGRTGAPGAPGQGGLPGYPGTRGHPVS